MVSRCFLLRGRACFILHALWLHREDLFEWHRVGTVARDAVHHSTPGLRARDQDKIAKHRSEAHTKREGKASMVKLMILFSGFASLNPKESLGSKDGWAWQDGWAWRVGRTISMRKTVAQGVKWNAVNERGVFGCETIDQFFGAWWQALPDPITNRSADRPRRARSQQSRAVSPGRPDASFAQHPRNGGRWRCWRFRPARDAARSLACLLRKS